MLIKWQYQCRGKFDLIQSWHSDLFTILKWRRIVDDNYLELLGEFLTLSRMFLFLLTCIKSSRQTCVYFYCSSIISIIRFTSSCLSYLRYLCLFTYSGVQLILCCVGLFFLCTLVANFFVLSIFDCPFGIL
jgi:hypothetical protein